MEGRQLLHFALALACCLAVGRGQNLSCTFEQNLCQWRQVQGTANNSDWRLKTGTTSTPNTGPSYDHTLGRGRAGHYAYFETSEGRRGNKAQLTSPAIRVANHQTFCLSLWYYMYGMHVSTLTVYLNTTRLWTRSGNQGNQWHQAFLPVSGPVSNQKIVIEALKGRGNIGDIAIDDIKWQNGPCQSSATIQPSTSHPGGGGSVALGCDFESPSLCGYRQDHSDNFDWVRNAGPTATATTGPNADHTTGTSTGHYMYVKGSNRGANTKARLLSPAYPGTRPMCLHFWYNMYGSNMGTLNVYAKPTSGSALGAPIWKLSGNQGQGWQVAQKTIPAGAGYSVVFEAVRGNGSLGDMALDDVLLTNGDCPDPGNCNFDANMCTYVNNQGRDDFDWIRSSGSTSSSFTGPAQDHTHGNSQGHYVYIEASAPQQRGDRAILLSQMLPALSGRGQRCVKFWYSMLGAQTGTLNVGLATADGRFLTRWTLSGDQGSTWRFGRMALSMPNTTFKIFFEGIVGYGNAGDIAIDDITVTSGWCSCADSVSCNFDVGMCSWHQQKDDNFDWTRQRSSTSSIVTGPSHDHTTGNGYYIYTEVSKAAANHSARIRSKTISPTESTQCLSFWYHLYGESTGTLNLYVTTGSGLGTRIWTRTGSQGNQWTKASVTIDQGRTSYAMVIEGVGGNAYLGDMAVDDIVLAHGTCTGVTVTSGPGTTSTVAPGGAAHTCDFEGNVCGYTQDTTDNYDWSRTSRSTTTTGTGPSNDHTYGTSQGHYMYMEASNKRVGQKARLLSPVYHDSGSMCLQFYYHMYGTGMGVLSVYTKVVFEGIRGTNFRADIAIDDISINQGACASDGSCDFETGLCTWVNTHQGDDFDWTMTSGKTATGSTGPTADHTRGDSQGKYLFIETSAPRAVGHKAWLVSENFPPVSASGRCIKFWYSMFGATVDTLTVYLRRAGQNDTYIWRLKGQQSRGWLSGQAPIPRVSVDYSIVFEGVRGRSYTGDIAIDDISFTQSSCGTIPSTAAPPTTVSPPTTHTTPSTTPNTGPFNCNFEGNMCGWAQDRSDQFDWIRSHGTTQTQGTGPTGDHTQANHGGYYMYIETSNNRKNGDKARLVSPNVSPGQYCLTFWYFMYGQNVDHFNVYIMAGTSLPSVPIWTRLRDQGRLWRRANVDIPLVMSPFNVVFEGVRGLSYRGDIALDDISLASGSCSAGPTTASGVPNITSCNFEAADICGFTQQSSGDQFDWTRHSGRTSSDFTGPTNDHTYGTGSGHYMYTEVSVPRHVGDKAVLTSFVVAPSPTTPVCVNFWYHMSGRDIGTLNAYVKNNNGRNQKRIWSLHGDQGDGWKLASVSVPGLTQAWQVAFEAIRGGGVLGDIAIDDFSVSSSGCGGGHFSGNCNFDNGLCTWSQDHSGQFDWIIGSGSTSSSGKYMFIEASSPRRLNDTAFLASEMLPAGSASCFNFWYNMYGRDINILMVWVRQNANSMQVPIFQLKGQQTSASVWKQAHVPIPAQKDAFSIVFEGVRGPYVLGDIAIDDVSFDNSPTCTLTPNNARPTVNAVTFRPLPPTTPVTTKVTTHTTAATTTVSTAGAVSCAFTRNLCGWSQDRSDNFDWQRHTHGTPSGSTGPSADHTTGSGYYIYIETSSHRLNDKARLLSPNLHRTTPGCFSFWYNMYGQHVNTLSFYLASNYTLPGSLVWTLMGTQGPGWRSAQFSVPAGTRQIVVEASRGPGYMGDIALDDFKLQDNCPQSNGSVISGMTCNFEDSHVCGYVNDREDFTWTRKTGGTSSSNTGPPSDHTYGTSRGHYMYTEASNPHHPGQKAGLISPQTSGGPHCLTFWYHMYGSQMGRLNVYTRMGNTRGTPVWSLSSSQGNRWRVHQISLNPASDWRLEFEGVLGRGVASDIAIDDVNVTTGSCASPGECNFDSGTLCSYTNVHNAGDIFDWTLQRNGTTTSGTGPSTDHSTSSSSGYYVFIESSHPRRRGDKAWLQSESLSKTGGSTHCLSFWYHMYGTSIGTLNVYLATNGSLPGAIHWKLSSSQANAWLQGRFPVTSPVDFNVVFEGVIGSSYRGDIAVDDITYTTGVCAFTPPQALPPSLRTTSPAHTSPSVTTPPVTATSLPGVFNCNFESNLCGWTQSHNDQFDWTRQRQPTSSSNTGPRSDHTTGHGYYIYIETSAPRRNNDKAQILSPTQTGTGVQCLTFWHHMYGAHVRTLNVYVTSDSNLGTPVWTKSGTDGNAWKQTTVDIDLGNTTKQYRVVLEGIRGNGVQGDIAVDDISMKTGYCQSSSTEAGTCNFEDPHICGYQQAHQPVDKFDWTRQARSTGTSNTGPSSDHTYGTARGHYMFIETSLPRVRGDNAMLLSAQRPASSADVCVTFYYHMYGSSIGTLNLRLKTGSTIGNPEWFLSGNQVNSWQEAQINLAASKLSSPFQIVFEGIRGSGYLGDIAIDDVNVTSGGCPSSNGGCNFESGLCTWHNVRSDNFDWQLKSGRTMSANTGPAYDHTQGLNARVPGKYVYMEASSPRRSGDVAWLVSQTFRPSQSRCMKFWYHMNGANIGALHVLVQVGSSNYTVWSQRGDKGDKWIFAQAPVVANLDYHVVFVGIRGNGPMGDIALDDIAFTNTRCTEQGGQNITGTPPTFTTAPTATTAQGSAACNFDASFCSWTQDKMDTFDWTRNRGSTPTIGTGPTGDHTSGNGYYAFIETSQRHRGDKARLVSPQVSGSSMCLTFWYLMYGDHVANLNVYTRTGPALGASVFTRSGTQSRTWLKASVDTGSSVPFQVVMEATVGAGYRGDIAIDDVSMANGSCTPATPDHLSCDFEDGQWCGYQQDHNDNFDWSRKTGTTDTASSGPTNDHTYGTARGHYIYIETSAPRRNGDKARLNSQSFQASGSHCVEFWYHMYGSTVGALNVYLKQGTTLGTPVFSKHGNQHNKWTQGRVNLGAGLGSVQVVFEGVRGSSYLGDIALDDIRLQPGACGQSPGDCSFDVDSCSWTNSAGDDFEWLRGSGRTTTTGTGPSTDHTTGNATGVYMFIESSMPRVPGHRAILQSGLFAPGNNSYGCMKFWYNMNGPTIGTLNVWVSPQPNATSASVLWSLSGQQGNVWKQGILPIPAQTSSYMILLEAIRGRSYTGDIAIDDVSFSNTQPCNLTPSTAVVSTTVPPTTTLPPATIPNGFNCDFRHGLCSWVQDQTDTNGDWHVYAANMGHSGTAPANDHNGHAGYYLYMEASTAGRYGSTTRLISPTLNPAAAMCLGFWYHMYGTHINALNVLLTTNGTTGSNLTLWSRNHTQGNVWHHAQIRLGGSAFSGFNNVVFEAVRGQSYRGDIAIDDITLTVGACNDDSSVSHIDCDFEASDICKYRQETTDDFNWTRNQRITGSSNTGPSADRTYGTNSGHYMYIEASSPRRAGQTARLWTPVMAGTGCVSFWYNMYGAGMGTLRVYGATSPSTRGQPLWSLSGNQGRGWYKAQVKLPSTAGLMVGFEGTVGRNYTSDMAIDDVKLEPTCPTLGSCDFEKDYCDWTQQSSVHSASLVRAKPNSPIFSGGINHPRADHTLGTNGTYLFFSDSMVLMPRSSHLRLISPSLPASSVSGTCFHFYFINYGRAFSTLSVNLQQQSSTNMTTLWKLNSVNQASSGFNEGQISFNSTATYHLILDVLTLGGRGHVALDDFTFKPGMCAAKPNTANAQTGRPTGTPVTTPSPSNNASSAWDCTFEQGLCSYQQLKDDQFDWTLTNGSTSSTGTGPSFDHTLGTGAGHYVFIETSSPRHPNDKAHLASPPVTDGQPKCLTFWYHMFGPHVNQLNVYTKVFGSSYGNPVWTHQRTIDANWHQATVTLRNTHTYNIVFEGVRGTNYLGDIGLDDIRLTDGPCADSSLNLKCTFEDSTICGFTQSRTDTFDWTRSHTTTNSSGTGPTNDHTYGTSTEYVTLLLLGHYMYIEASNPRHAGDKARLISPSQPSTRGACLRFWYHMYGRTMGSLHVYLRQGGSLVKTLYTISGNQDNHWIQAETTVIFASSTWQAVFEGVVGSSYYSDIAIDDVSITSGSCGGAQGNCDFEKDTCTWSNVGGDTFDWLRTSGSTPSYFTGPTTDHTESNTNGHYMFMESSAPRVQGDKTWLVSQPFPAFSSGSVCFNFWYHMYGQSIGSLNVYIVVVAGWLNVYIVVVTGSLNVYIVVVTGLLNVYLVVVTGSLNVYLVVCTGSLNVYIVVVAGWLNVYIVVVAGWLNVYIVVVAGWLNVYIVVVTGSLNVYIVVVTGSLNVYIVVVTGWLNVHIVIVAGSLNVYIVVVAGSLNVYIDDTANTTHTMLWSQKGQQGNSWRQGQMPIPPQSKEYHVRFEAIEGSNVYGDIAIDDVSFTSSPQCIYKPTSANVTQMVTTPTAATPTPTAFVSHSPYDCSFESNMCSWTQDKTDVFDWHRSQGPTGTSSTGPTTDHTSGRANGWYMYIETSAPRVTNDTARLVSQTIPASTAYCFTFWYHMYGIHVNRLNVYIRMGSNLGPAVWTRQQTQGNKWIQGQVLVPGQPSPTNLVFEGIRGPSYRGDIGLDDIRATTGACNNQGTSVACTFEGGSCGWSQDKTDSFDWSTHTGSSGPGPSADHTLRTAAGHYMYMTNGSPHRTGQKARLVSTQVTASGSQCFSFFYSLSGSNVGTLNVYVMTGTTLNVTNTPVWTKNVAQGTQWVPAQATVQATGPYKIVMEGVVGSGTHGDIAIDDLAIRNGSCPHAANNDFEHGFGVWTNPRRGDNFDWLMGRGLTHSGNTGPSTDHTLGTAQGNS
ncbi:hypothetical protein ACOMHN_065230 [Nucella lapillus]